MMKSNIVQTFTHFVASWLRSTQEQLSNILTHNDEIPRIIPSVQVLGEHHKLRPFYLVFAY